MRLGEIIEGLQILAKYEDKGLGAHLNGADHDVIWATTAEVEELDEDVEEWPVDEDGEPIITDTRITQDDAARLKKLGWFISGEYSYAWTAYV